MILYGKPVTEKIYEDIESGIRMNLEKGWMDRMPSLRIITASNDKASEVYVRNKIKRAKELGFDVQQIILDEDRTQKHLEAIIKQLNEDNSVDGVILQLPVYPHLDEFKANELLDPMKDIDGFTSRNTGLLSLGKEGQLPCTPAGMRELLKFYSIPMEGEHVCIVNRSNIVGKPFAQMMLEENATVTICHSRTIDLHKHIFEADIVVTAIGRPKMFNHSYFREDQTLIDVSMNRDSETNKLCGDIDFDDVIDTFDENINVTPVPGSIGPCTIAMLMYNTYKAWAIKTKEG